VRSTSYDRKPRDGDPLAHPTAPRICRRPGCGYEVVDRDSHDDEGDWCSTHLAAVTAQRDRMAAERTASKWKRR
jgi:hypothetical protein